jgi:thiamine biosynthesis lipoprotein
MGMPVTIDVRAASGAAPRIDVAFEQFRLLDRIFSPFRTDSEVCRINRGELLVDEAGDEVSRAIEIGRLYEAATEGFFSVWLNGRFDPSGLVKGWAIDRACSILERAGAESYFVDAGGDLRARGGNGGGLPWRVGVRHPVERDRFVRVVTGMDLAIATSGTYEKGFHVINPHTGNPAVELISATVVGPDIVAADVYATAILAMGTAGLDFLERIAGYEAFVIGSDLLAGHTSGFDLLCAGGDVADPAGEAAGGG